MDFLRQTDRTLFFFINQQCRNYFFDWLAPLLRNPINWLPLYVLMASVLIYKLRKNSWLVFLFAGITVLLTDQLSASVLKPLVHRLRPCNNPEIQNLVHRLIDCGAGYSFCSSHAANHFGIATFFALLYGKQKPWLAMLGFAWAASISISQVYVGVHYPADITVGACLGLTCGYVCGKLCLHYQTKKQNSISAL